MVQTSSQFSGDPLDGIHADYLPYATVGTYLSPKPIRTPRFLTLSLVFGTCGLSALVSFSVLYFGVFTNQEPAPAPPAIHCLSPLLVPYPAHEEIKKLELAIAGLTSLVVATTSSPVPSPEAEMRTVRVAFPKVFLRSKPEKTSAALMAVSQNTRLVVTDEHVGWLKVYAPSGEEAWINDEVVVEDDSTNTF